MDESNGWFSRQVSHGYLTCHYGFGGITLLAGFVREAAQPQLFYVIPVMTGNDDGDMESFHEVDKKAHDLSGRDGVQRRGGFIGDYDGGLVGQSAGDGDPLPFSYGEKGRELVEMAFDPQGFHQGFYRPIVGQTEQPSRKIDVVSHREIGQ